MDSSRIDPVTGLLTRAAFLEEVRETNETVPSQLRRGCLLVLQFPILKTLLKNNDSSQDCDDTIRHLLAIVETRLRSRDTLGRISHHSLCVLLKGCRASDAVVVADQYLSLLRDVVLDIGGRQVPLDCRYRIVTMDKSGIRTGSRVSRLYVSPPITNELKLAKQIDVAGNRVDLSTSKVVSLNVERANRHIEAVAENTDIIEDQPGNSVFEINKSDSAKAWRLRPGMLITRMPLLCCYMLQPLYKNKQTAKLQNADILTSMLSALALHVSGARPVVESQLILPVQAEQIEEGFAQWISVRCKTSRVAPSDICLSVSVDSLASDLRRIAPELRLLNRYGIRLMLEGVNSSNQFRMMKNIAHFDYLQISGRALNDSLRQLAARVNLESIITEARTQDCEICTGGIDNDILMKHALAMQIDIGFGRSCGTSVAFPAQAWTAVDTAADRDFS